MKVYENLDNFREREHVVEITIQKGEYKGKLISLPITGNCFGLSILDIVDEYTIYDVEDFKKVGCSIDLIDEGEEEPEWFRYVLTNEEGEQCEGEDYCREFKNMIVGINIVSCNILDGK